MGNGLSDHDVLSLAVGVFFQIPELLEIKGNGKRQDGVDSMYVRIRRPRPDRRLLLSSCSSQIFSGPLLV